MSVSISPNRRKRRALARKRQEARWVAKSGPVTIIRPDTNCPKEGTTS